MVLPVPLPAISLTARLGHQADRKDCPQAARHGYAGSVRNGHGGFCDLSVQLELL
ncbi:hypothetical protein D3C71_1048550 [compost metagenome]